MFSLFSLSVVAVLAAVARAQGALTINTPASLVQCQPVQLSWANGKAPFYASAIPAGQASAAPLAKFPPQDGSAFTWVVNLRQGTDITIKITDGTGATAYSSPLVVQEGFDDKCLTEGVNVTPGAAGAAGGAAGQNQTNAPPSSNGGNASDGQQAQPQPQPQNQTQPQNGTQASAAPNTQNATGAGAQPQASPAAGNSTGAALSAGAGLVAAVALIVAAV